MTLLYLSSKNLETFTWDLIDVTAFTEKSAPSSMGPQPTVSKHGPDRDHGPQTCVQPRVRH